MLRFLIFNVLILGSFNLSGQTCCSAGAPISSSLEIRNANNNTISVQVGYEHKGINLLIDDNMRLTNDPRSRNGQNASIKIDYTLSQRWAFSSYMPFVFQSRKTISDTQTSRGRGDLSLITQYTLISDPTLSFNISGGIKIPTGKINHRGPSQILLSPDMQSGSGTVDFLVRSSVSASQFLLPLLSSFASLTYRINRINNNFGKTQTFNGRRFGFGDELTFIMGTSYLYTIKQAFISPDASLKLRWSTVNTEQQVSAPNSGGYWLSIPIGISFIPNEQSSIRIYNEIPIYQNLNGLQITTSYTIGIQLNYNIIKNQLNTLIK